MKKLFVLALAAAAMVACVNEEITETVKGGEIAFDNAFIENATRATDPSLTADKLQDFAVWAYVGAPENTVFAGDEVNKASGVWSYEGEKKYWLPGQEYHFAAVAPFGAVAAEAVNVEGGKLNGFTFTNDGGVDLLYATSIEQGSANRTEAVAFTFEHLLAKVNFNFKNACNTAANTTIVITDVAMTSAESADYNGAEWSNYGEAKAIAFGDVVALAYNASADAAAQRLVIPAAATAEYTITFTATIMLGNDPVQAYPITSTVSGVQLAAGHAYNFSAVITPETLGLGEITFAVDVNENWENGGQNPVYAGETSHVATAAELEAAIADPEVAAVVLTQDIELNSTTLTRAEGDANVTIAKDFVIDGKGHKLTYSGSGDRVIDVVKADNAVKNVTIKNLTINITSSYCQRGINFNNTNGTLVVENVKFEGTAPTYAINFPGSADGVKATIKDSHIVGNIALNVWGENMVIDVINSTLSNYDDTEAEDYTTIKLNNDGSTSAEGSIINIKGGKIQAYNEKDEPNYVTANATAYGQINISETTEVIGNVFKQVAVVTYANSNCFYGVGSIQGAIEKCIESNGTSVRVTSDVELTKPLTIANGQSVVLDLCGHTVSAVDNATGSYGLITNKGKLTINGGGKLQLKATNNRGWNAYSSVISNTVGGNLTVEGGVVVEHLGGTDMAYGIDNLTNGKGTSAVATIKDATVKSPYRAVRQFLNGIEATNELYVKNGAVIEGTNKSIWMQDPSKNANTGKLVVEAGAQLKGNVYLFVTAGSTAWPVEVSIAAAALGESEVISGNVPEGYLVVKEEGTWKVVEGTVAADQKGLEDAVVADGHVALSDGNYTMPSVSGKEVTISGSEDVVITVGTPNMSGSDITFEGVTVKGSGSFTGVQHVNTVTYNGVKVVGTMCLYGEKVVFNNCSFELSGDYIWCYSAKEVEFNGCEFNTTGKAILVYNEGAGANKVTVKDCVFNASAGAKAGAIANQNCAAIEIDNHQNSGVGAAHNVITSGNTYSENFSGEWRIKNYVAGNAITVNGNEYTQIAVDGKLMTIDANRNVTVVE